MAKVQVAVKFDPQTLKAYSRNEATMHLVFESVDSLKQYWCECEIAMKSPLSLAGDRELDAGRTRVGIVRPNESKSKQVKWRLTSSRKGFRSASLSAFFRSPLGSESQKA